MGFKNSSVNGIPRASKSPIALSLAVAADFTPGSTNIPFLFDTVLEDTAKAYNKATGIYTVPISGTYVVTFTAQTSTGSTANVTLSINGLQRFLICGVQSANNKYAGAVLAPLKRGDQVSAQSQQAETFVGGGAGTLLCTFGMGKIS